MYGILAPQIDTGAIQAHRRGSLPVHGATGRAHGRVLRAEGEVDAETSACVLKDAVELAPRGACLTGSLDKSKLGMELPRTHRVVRQDSTLFMTSAVRKPGHGLIADHGKRG